MALAPEESVKRAVAWLAEYAKLVVEAGGAVGVAALLTGAVRARGKTVVLLSGGNIAPATLAEYLASETPRPPTDRER
jgi:threonine dehydratase